VATVSLRRVGPVEKWSVELTVDEALPAWAGDGGKLVAQSVVGLDLGWRVVAGAKPEELSAAMETLAQWRSPARLARLRELWAERRFEGDEVGFQALSAWAESDWHAWRAETRERQWALRHRRELYRVFANTLAKKYAYVALENTRFDNIARRPPPDSAEAVNETARSNRVLAASGELRLTVSNRFGKERSLVVETAHTTSTCHACGVEADFDSAEHLERVCPSCGAVWDQDDNAAILHCRLGEEELRRRAGPADADMTAAVSPVPGPGGRWAKAKAQKAAKRSGAAPETTPT